MLRLFALVVLAVSFICVAGCDPGESGGGNSTEQNDPVR